MRFFFRKDSVALWILIEYWCRESFWRLFSCVMVVGIIIFLMILSFRDCSFVILKIVFGRLESMIRGNFSLLWVFVCSFCFSLLGVYLLFKFSCFNLFSFIFDRNIVNFLEYRGLYWFIIWSIKVKLFFIFGILLILVFWRTYLKEYFFRER